MQTNLRGRDLISLQEWTKEEIDTIFDVAVELKRDRALGRPHPLLRDKARRGSIILHSLPRMDELPADVDATRHHRNWAEELNGLSHRIALLTLLLGAAD